MIYFNLGFALLCTLLLGIAINKKEWFSCAVLTIPAFLNSFAVYLHLIYN